MRMLAVREVGSAAEILTPTLKDVWSTLADRCLQPGIHDSSSGSSKIKVVEGGRPLDADPT